MSKKFDMIQRAMVLYMFRFFGQFFEILYYVTCPNAKNASGSKREKIINKNIPFLFSLGHKNRRSCKNKEKDYF